MIKKHFQSEVKENKYNTLNLIGSKNKGIIYKLEWEQFPGYNYLNFLTSLQNKTINFKK